MNETPKPPIGAAIDKTNAAFGEADIDTFYERLDMERENRVPVDVKKVAEKVFEQFPLKDSVVEPPKPKKAA